MKLELDEIENIAHLARLQINDSELVDYQDDLNNIINLVNQMQAVDTDGVKPLAHPHEASQRLREDRVTEKNLCDKFQKIAPDVANGLFKVPRVID